MPRSRQIIHHRKFPGGASNTDTRFAHFTLITLIGRHLLHITLSQPIYDLKKLKYTYALSYLLKAGVTDRIEMTIYGS